MFNNRVNTSEFYDNLKRADVTPIYKKMKRPVSILTTFYERLLYQQIANYMEKYLPENLCGFRKG